MHYAHARNPDRVFENVNWRGYSLQVLFVTPERLTMDLALLHILTSLYTNRDENDNSLLSRFVVDEAHCVAEASGGGFRPAYMKLTMLKRFYPRVPILALTATATDTMQVSLRAHGHVVNCPPALLERTSRPGPIVHAKCPYNVVLKMQSVLII